MADQDLLNAFDDCINRLAFGQTVDDCLRAYPQYAPALRPMLEAGLAIRRARVNAAETTQAQARVRARVEMAARAAPTRTAYPLRPLAALAAALLIVFLVVSGGAVTLAQNSLPGDPLYSIKRLTENVRLTISENNPALQAEFAARRIGEIQQVLAFGRATDVDFAGKVEAISGADWVVAGLPLRVPENIPGAAEIRTGDEVEINAYTTSTRTLIAREILLVEPGERESLPTLTPVPTRPVITSTLPPTTTPASTKSPPTHTPSPSWTPTQTPTPTRTPTIMPTPSTTGCLPFQPQGWEAYTIQAGDTLSALAAVRGITLDELMRVNCLTNPRLIFAGQPLYLPPGPPPPRLTVQPTTFEAPAQPTTVPDEVTDTPPDNQDTPEDSTNGNDNDDDDDDSNDNDDDNDD